MSFLTSFFPKKALAPNQTRMTLVDLLNTMREGVIVIGEDMRIFVSNDAAYDAFGRRNGALQDKRLTEVIRDLNLHEAFRQALEERKTSDVHLNFVATEKKYDVRIAPYDFDDRRGAIGIFYDVSEIERLQNIRREFLSNISHELRTPLTSILAFVETLEDGAIEDEENNLRFLAVIRRNAERMHALINDILELSSIEARKVSIDPRPISLARAVDEVFVSLSAKASERGISLISQIEPTDSVRVDVIRFEQMLTNLVDNGIKFNRDGGNVTVSYRREGNFDQVLVEDTGEGIAPEHLQRIFERFYRTDRARSREIGGTGLGLAIVKHLARLHGGEVSVKSVTGKGSVFCIGLPVGE